MADRNHTIAWHDDDFSPRDDEPAHWETGSFYPGERIGAPLPSRARRAARRLLATSLIASIGWAAYQTQATWRPLAELAWRDIAAQLAASVPPDQPRAIASQTATAEPPLVEPLPGAKDVAEIAGTNPAPPQAAPSTPTETAPPAESITTASIATSDTGENSNTAEPATVAPLPEPEADPADPLQKKAVNAGLHPRVSKVLLESLTDADYRNARTAIQKALAEAADSEKFIWPRGAPDAAAKRAVFQVHFVTGSGGDCRRYIVTVVKNGWTTTAPPMEKCGLRMAARVPADRTAAKDAASRAGGLPESKRADPSTAHP